MRLGVPLLGLLAALLAWPAVAQTTDSNDPNVTGQVQTSPLPVRKTAPRREETDGDGAGNIADPTGRDPDGAEAGGPGNKIVISPDGVTIETRTLPILRRTVPREIEEDEDGGRTDGDADAPEDETAAAGDADEAAAVDDGDEITETPLDPIKEPEKESETSRFVRVPEGKTYEIDEWELLGAPLPTPETQLQLGATLRQLDKMTGQIVTFDINVGETRQVARLAIMLDACRAPGDNDTHGTMAHIKIWDTKNEEAETVFAGWMFADSPALSALDHPRYDLWVINCTTVSAEASAGNE